MIFSLGRGDQAKKDSFMNSNVGSQCEILCLRIFKLLVRQLETSCLCLTKPQTKMWPHFKILLCSVLGEIVLMLFSHFMSFRFIIFLLLLHQEIILHVLLRCYVNCLSEGFSNLQTIYTSCLQHAMCQYFRVSRINLLWAFPISKFAEFCIVIPDLFMELEMQPIEPTQVAM